MEMKTKEEIFESIRNWEIDAGESFVDYFDGRLNEVNYLFWCLGKGCITSEQFQSWEEEDIAFSNDIVFGTENYSVVQEPDFDFSNREVYDEAYDKAMMILAEFLSSTQTYQRRVEEFFKENS
jgi:hypothetical protein